MTSFSDNIYYKIKVIILRNHAVFWSIDDFLLHQFFPLNPPNRMQIQNKNDNKFILDTLSYSPFLLLHSSVWETKHFLGLIVIWNKI